MLVSPVVRVDLRDQLPPAVQQQLAQDPDGAAGFGCQMVRPLEAPGASQRFKVIWQVMEHGQDLHILALSVEPDGDCVGATDPEASAAVASVTQDRTDGRSVTVVRLHVSWHGRKGCDQVKAEADWELRADSPTCARPKPMKILTPVE